MKRTIIAIIVLFTLINISSFFIIKSQAPPFTVFTGAVHYPPDYLYYLSYITQGREHWVLGENLKSAETRSGELLNWFYVAGGRIGYILHISPPYTYQLLVVVASVLYMMSAYGLLTVCFPKQPKTRLVAFIIFLFSNAFPEVHYINGSWDVGIFYPFNNIGHPFIRLSNVPHHTLIQAAIMASFSFCARYIEHKHKKTIGILALLGMVLASMQPLQWAFVTGVIGLWGLYLVVIHRNKDGTSWISPLLPAIALGLAGLPFAIYIKYLYSIPPHSYMIVWEKNQQIIIPFLHFITLHGPVMLLGILASPLSIHLASVATIPLYLYSTLSLLLFFSPIPEKMGLLNIRFISVIPVFLASYISALMLRKLAQTVAPNTQNAFIWFCALILLSCTIPVSYLQLIDRSSAIPGDLNTFVPLGAYQLYERASTLIKPTETTLVVPLFSLSFPAFTGRHVYVADVFGTLDFEKKEKESVDFFNRVPTPDERIKWLKQKNISYIFTYAWTPISDLPDLSIAYKNDYAILYRVR